MNAWFLTSIFMVFCLGIFPAVAEDEHRQADAHQHGHGNVNIAIEGNRIDIELEVPGSDIVGFEHAPETKDQKNKIAEAKTKLVDILSLIKINGSPDCKVDKTDIVYAIDDHEKAENGKGHGDHDDHANEAKKDDDGDGHAEFHATYQLSCKNIDRIEGLTFGYFKAFAAAQELDVNIVTAKNQTKFEVTRDKPVIALNGSI